LVAGFALIALWPLVSDRSRLTCRSHRPRLPVWSLIAGWPLVTNLTLIACWTLLALWASVADWALIANATIGAGRASGSGSASRTDIAPRADITFGTCNTLRAAIAAWPDIARGTISTIGSRWPSRPVQTGRTDIALLTLGAFRACLTGRPGRSCGANVAGCPGGSHWSGWACGCAIADTTGSSDCFMYCGVDLFARKHPKTIW
jgi:hypothetical protein